MKDIRIDNRSPWQKIHWRTIFSIYGNSPWFGYFFEELENLYLKKVEYLVDWNMACQEWAFSKLGVDKNHNREMEDSDVLPLDYRNRILPSNFQNEVHGPFLKYPQVFEDRTGFQVNMSILDLICCEGKQAGTLLKEMIESAKKT